MLISDFKAMIDALAVLHPDARVDIAYPITFRGKETTRTSHITGYRVYSVGTARPTVRLVVNYAREPDAVAETGTSPTAQEE